MDIRPAVLGQMQAAVAMIRQCVERVPESEWDIGTPHRPFWRIAYHALFFTHLYAMPNLARFETWEHHQDDAMDLWETPDPKPVRTYTREELLAYCDHVASLLPEVVLALDISQPDSGFDWYTLPKIDHLLLGLRHTSVHLGQLQERCYQAGVELNWVGKA